MAICNEYFDMTTTPQLTAQQLALYLGQKVSTDIGIGVIDTIALHNTVLVTFEDDEDGEACDFPCDEVNPILRKLSSLTEDEAVRIYEILSGKPAITPKVNGGYSSMLEYLHSDTNYRFKEITFLCGHPQTWQYLLSIGIDLFGWIDADLAIDKATIEQK